MHPSAASQRRRQRRRTQIRRRRAVALVILVTLVLLAVWAAYAVPGETPARVPPSAAVSGFSEQSPASEEPVVVAEVEGVDVLLPVARDVTTAVGYHPVDNSDTVAFAPRGDRLSGGDLGQRLADIFASGGDMQYYLMDGSGSEDSESTAGLDVGAVPGSSVVSPLDGKVTAVKKYSILGRYTDVEVNIQFAGDPSLLMVLTHISHPKVALGDVVTGGETQIGVVRGFSSGLDQALSRYTSDTGDHVQMVVLRVTSQMAGL